MREEARVTVWPGELYKSASGSAFGLRETVWEVQSVHDTVGGIPHAVLRRANQEQERKSIAVGVLLDPRFYLPLGSTAASNGH